MNAFYTILEKSATKLGFPFEVCQSDKSEASYLKIACYSNSDLNDFFSCLTVRLANHDACTGRSASYEIQLDSGFDFSELTTTWGIDEDSDFSESALEDEFKFNNENEMSNYMATCLVTKLKSKI
jgi:hypothetical protein